MTHGKFFENLDFAVVNGTVEIEATGPKDTGETIKEICVWVFQRQGENEVAATEMSTVRPDDLKQDKESWTFPIGKLESKLDFMQGPAIALAVALVDVPITDAEGNPRRAQRVLLWSQSINLRPTGEAGRMRAETTT